MGVAMLGRKPYLYRSDWWEWGISSVMVQLHQSDRMCLKDGAGEWFMLKESVQNKWCHRLDLVPVTRYHLSLLISSPCHTAIVLLWICLSHLFKMVITTCVTAGRGWDEAWMLLPVSIFTFWWCDCRVTQTLTHSHNGVMNLSRSSNQPWLWSESVSQCHIYAKQEAVLVSTKYSTGFKISFI